MDKDIENKHQWFQFNKLVWGVLLTVGFLIGLALTIYVIKFGVPLPIHSLGTLEQFGSFGDFVGGIMNPLLQFIVIAMLFWSIDIQRKELSATNNTLKMTQKELEQSRKATELSAISLEKQATIQQQQLERTAIENIFSITASDLETLTTFQANIRVTVETNEVVTHTRLESVVRDIKSRNYRYVKAVTIVAPTEESEQALFRISGKVEELQFLIKHYALEGGSSHIVEHWLKKLFPYLVLLTKYQNFLPAVYSCVNDHDKILSEIVATLVSKKPNIALELKQYTISSLH